MKISGVILAGGKSSRMGVHKGGLMLEGVTFTENIARELNKLAGDVVVSCVETTADVPSWCRRVHDIYKDCGPLGGLHGAFAGTDCDVMLVSACDTPFVKAELYQYLLDKLENHDGVIAVSEGRTHPLIAVYRRSMADVFEAQLEEENYRIMRALDKADVLFCDLPQDMAAMARNINTPEEYEKTKT